MRKFLLAGVSSAVVIAPIPGYGQITNAAGPPQSAPAQQPACRSEGPPGAPGQHKLFEQKSQRCRCV